MVDCVETRLLDGEVPAEMSCWGLLVTRRKSKCYRLRSSLNGGRLTSYEASTTDPGILAKFFNVMFQDILHKWHSLAVSLTHLVCFSNWVHFRFIVPKWWWHTVTLRLARLRVATVATLLRLLLLIHNSRLTVHQQDVMIVEWFVTNHREKERKS